MTKQGFEEYLYAVYGRKNGTANSYITAIRFIDEMFTYDDVFGQDGKSITCIDQYVSYQIRNSWKCTEI